MARRSQAVAHTQAEFAYILLFIALGALALLFLQYRAAREERAFLLDQIARMEEKKNAAYPCWIRPDGVIPQVAGTLVIHSADHSELSRTNGGYVEIREPGTGLSTGGGISPGGNTAAAGNDISPAGNTPAASAASGWTRRDALFSAVRRTFQQDNQYAASNRCYIRVKVENRTNDYNLFLESAQVLKSLGIVVVNE